MNKKHTAPVYRGRVAGAHEETEEATATEAANGGAHGSESTLVDGLRFR